MKFFNKIHIKFIVASGLILALALMSFTLIISSYFEDAVTQLSHEELERDLEYERQRLETEEHPITEEDVHQEVPETHPEGTTTKEVGDVHTDLTERIEQEKIIISENLSKIRKTVAWMALIAILISSVIMQYISGRITKPIINLKKAADEIGMGNLDADIKIESGDEVGELAKAFKSMTIRTKEAYLNIQKERAQLMASINNLSLGFILKDVRGKVILANHALRQMFHSENLELEKIPEFMDKNVTLSGNPSKTRGNETEYSTKDAVFEDKFLKIYYSPVILDQNRKEIVGSVILIEDMTQQKRLEASKDSFIAITAHELRTPLTIIKGNTQLLLETSSGKITDQQSKILNIIEKNSIRLLKIVNDFLNLAVLEENRLHLNTTNFDIVKLVNDVALDLKTKSEEKKLYIKISRPDEQLPDVFADSDKTREILINIIGNSLQYTKEGGITISFEEDGKFVKILIEDTGIGIDHKEHKSIFQKFHTVNEQFLRSKEYGSGIGLYISKLLIESMGGVIKLEKSDPNVGTVFSIALPVKK